MNTTQLVNRLQKLDPIGLCPVVVDAPEEGYDELVVVTKLMLGRLEFAKEDDGEFHPPDTRLDELGPLVSGEPFNAILLPGILR